MEQNQGCERQSWDTTPNNRPKIGFTHFFGKKTHLKKPTIIFANTFLKYLPMPIHFPLFPVDQSLMDKAQGIVIIGVIEGGG